MNEHRTPSSENVRQGRVGVIGIVAAMLFTTVGAGSVFAQVADAVTILGASVTSDEWTPPVSGPVLAVAAVGSSTAECKTATYDDDGTLSVAPQAVDLAAAIDAQVAAEGRFPSGALATTMGDYCFRNDGDADGELSVRLLARSSVEVGECSTVERGAEGGASNSCDDGDSGELDRIMAVSLQSSPGEGMPQCPGLAPGAGTNGTFHRGHQPGDSVPLYVVLAPGESCLLRLVITDYDAPTPDEALAAMTDTYAADLAVVLTETP